MTDNETTKSPHIVFDLEDMGKRHVVVPIGWLFDTLLNFVIFALALALVGIITTFVLFLIQQNPQPLVDFIASIQACVPHS